MLYFAYGSNLSSKRMLGRCPGAQSKGVYRLCGHILCFNMLSDDGSGKCNIMPTGQADNCVYGVLYDIPDAQERDLDKAESLGHSYRKQAVDIRNEQGEMVTALAYFALRIGHDLFPYHWYKEHVVRGLVEAGVPGDYVAYVDQIASVADPDNERQVREVSIYPHH